MDKTKRIAVLEDLARRLAALLASTIDHHSFDVVQKDEIPKILVEAREVLKVGCEEEDYETKLTALRQRLQEAEGLLRGRPKWGCSNLTWDDLVQAFLDPTTSATVRNRFYCKACGDESGQCRCDAPTVMTPATESDRIYPCKECGTMRTKAEGGTTFTVCDACWDKAHQKATTEPDIKKLRSYVDWAQEAIDRLKAALEGAPTPATEPDMVLVRREVIKAALRTPGMYVGVAEELIAALEGKALVPWLGFKGTP